MSARVLTGPPISGSTTIVHFGDGPRRTWVELDGWTGVFAQGLFERCNRAIEFAPGRVLVIAGGQGYVVDTVARRVVLETESPMLEDAMAIPTRDEIICSDLSDVWVYGADGIAWAGERIADDGIELTSATPEHVLGRNFWHGAWRPFELWFDGWQIEVGPPMDDQREPDRGYDLD